MTRIPQAIVLSFAGLILAGTLALKLPACATARSLTFVEALFTSTSAVCVTGLTIIDPGTRLSPFGQGVLLALIQLGGLGILSLSAFVLVALRGREDLSQRLYVEQAHGLQGIPAMSILRSVVLATLVVELLGTALLWGAFGARLGGWNGRTFWISLFHAVSAFCNAGFSLFPDNLNGFRDHWIVSPVIMALIVVGGIGFMVLADIRRLFRLPFRQWQWWRLALHTRVVLVTTLLLIAGGALLFAAFEWNNTLARSTLTGKLLGPFFYSVTCRTAGFDTIRTGSLAASTLLIGVVLMFIGASPGGTGGGVKTSTAAILACGAWSRFRSRGETECLGRTIPAGTVAKAVVTVAAFITLVGLANLGILIVERGSLPNEGSPLNLLDVLFETVSAIGTVGLSTGITSKLNPGSQLILAALMFLGRTGPLVVGASVIGRQRPRAISYPQEDLLVG